MDIDQFKATYRDMIERLEKALDIAGPLIGPCWSWTDDFDIEGDTIEATLSAFYSGGEDIETVSFPLEWLWTGGPDGDLSVTFHKGRKYQEALSRNKKAAYDTREQEHQDKRDRREYERLQLKFADDAADAAEEVA